jgi:hypothetical protein
VNRVRPQAASAPCAGPGVGHRTAQALPGGAVGRAGSGGFEMRAHPPSGGAVIGRCGCVAGKYLKLDAGTVPGAS